MYEHPDMSELLQTSQALGEFFSLGRLKFAGVDDGNSQKIVIPAAKPVVIELAPKCPRDRMTQSLYRFLSKA